MTFNDDRYDHEGGGGVRGDSRQEESSIWSVPTSLITIVRMVFFALVITGIVVVSVNYNTPTAGAGVSGSNETSAETSTETSTETVSWLTAVETIWKNSALLTLGSAAVAMGVSLIGYEVYHVWFILKARGEKTEPYLR